MMQVTVEHAWTAFSAPLLQFIRRQVADDATAEDILQDVFLKVHTRIDTLRDADKLQSWLYQLTRNAIIDYRRRIRITNSVSDDMPGLEYHNTDTVAQQLVPSVKAMLAELPAPYQEALLLTEYEGLTQKALAERLGISLSGAKSRVQRARQQLKQMLLDCCHFEFDRRGAIIRYQPRCLCCANGRCEPECRS